MNKKYICITAAFVSFILLYKQTFGQVKKSAYVDPTGTYQLVTKAYKRDGEIYGVTGGIQVKTLSKEKIVVVLGVNMGYKAYNSGALHDTLLYQHNRCTYIDQSDKSCRIKFKFNIKGVSITQKQADPNFGCGFGRSVFADGLYTKLSSKVPILKDPQTGELIR